MIIKSPTYMGIKFVVLVLVVLMLTGCLEMTLGTFATVIQGDIKQHNKLNRELSPNDLAIKSNLGLGIPINAPIVIHVNVNDEEKYLSIIRIEEKRESGTGTSGGDPLIDDDLEISRSYSFPLWYEVENSALESFRSLSTDVRIDREIDKPDNLDESLLWYENKAKEDPKAAYKLGLLYHLGSEIPFNYPLAKKWYLQSDMTAAKVNVMSMWGEYGDENTWVMGRRGPSDIKKLYIENWLYNDVSFSYKGCDYGYSEANLRKAFDSLIRKFRKDQKLIIDTKGLNAYIFHISIDYCDRNREILWPSKEKQLPNTLIVVKVYHIDGTDFGEYIFENNDFLYSKERYLRNVAYFAYNEVANKLVNSESFVNHYQSLYKR